MPESSLYERLGGVFAIAAVVDHFSDAVVQNPIVGQESKNPALRELAHEQSRQTAGPQIHAHSVGVQRCRRTLPVRGDETREHAPRLGGGPSRTRRFLPTSSTKSRPNLARTLDFFKVPEQEKEEVLAAFSAHKTEVTEGYTAAAKAGRTPPGRYRGPEQANTGGPCSRRRPPQWNRGTSG